MMALSFVASFFGIIYVEACYSVGLILGDFLWRFGHGDEGFVQFEVVSKYGRVGYHVMNQKKYCGID